MGRRLFAGALVLVVWAGFGCTAQPVGSETSYDVYPDAETTELSCVPDLDRSISAEELRPALGVEAKYLVSPPGETRRVDLKGDEQTDGRRVWDWSMEYENDKSIGISAEPIDDKWYADSYPDGEFALPVDLSGNTEGIYRTAPGRMLLLGLASREESPPNGKTLLVYEEPVVVYRFPIEEGQQWVSAGRVDDGTLQGTPYAGKDVYRVQVRALGEMELPRFGFDQVHRVDTEVTVQSAAGGSVTRRQVSFLTECFGEIARATSADGVTKTNFEQAAEVRRLGVRR